MTAFATTMDYKAFNQYEPPRPLSVVLNGGTVTLHVRVTDTVDTTTAIDEGEHTIDVAGREIKIVPTGGAVFNFGGGL